MSLSVESARVAIVVSSAFAIIGTLAGISAVLLVIMSKTYKFLVFRLILYLSLFNLGFSVVLGLEVLSADVSKPDNETLSIKSGWEGFCSFLGFADVYFNNSRTLMALVMSIYVFLMTVCKIEMKHKQKKLEVVGLVAVIFVSFLFPWIPFVFDGYGLSGVWCWIKDPDNTSNSAGVLGAKVGADIAPQFIMSVTCVVLIGGIIIVFCAGLGWTKGSSLHDEHMTLTKKVLPLLIYPAMYAIVTFFNGANIIFVSIAKYNNIALSITVVSVLQIVQLFLPLSLLLHAKMKSMLSVTCCSKGKTASAVAEGMSLQLPSSSSNVPMQPVKYNYSQ